jgi:hypothetical protein
LTPPLHRRNRGFREVIKVNKELLKAVNVYNPHNLCTQGGDGVFVSYIPQRPGRVYRNAKWQVVRPGYKNDPDGWWGDYGHKTFNVFSRAEKEPQRLAAIAWASERYGIKQWERSPFGSYHPKGTIERALKSATTAAAP